MYTPYPKWKVNRVKTLASACLLSLIFFAACKKDAKVTPAPVKTVDVVFPADSVSYTVDGKTYTLDNSAGVTTGNTDADRKVDSIVDQNHYYISGRKDSIFFYRTFNFSGTGTGFGISFFKKYAVNNMISGVIYSPSTQDDLFKPGNYAYGTDFTRENATNGVALAVSGAGQTYSNQTLGIPSPVTQASESNAHFQILTFKQLSDDQYSTQYLLEAKFDAMLFDDNGNAKPLSNGYIRMIVAVGK